GRSSTLRQLRSAATDRDQYRQAAEVIAPNVTRISLMSAFGGKADIARTLRNVRFIWLVCNQGRCALDQWGAAVLGASGHGGPVAHEGRGAAHRGEYQQAAGAVALDSTPRSGLSINWRMSLRERTRPGLGIVEPCLPSPAKAPPSGPGWIHEIKHDGFRIMARRDSAGVRLFTRHGNDFTSRFPLAVAALPALPGRSFLINGEAICTDESGLAVFELIRRARHGDKAVLCAFDLIELDGKDLRRSPVEH